MDGVSPGSVPYRRQYALISGNGKGPVVPFRASNAEVRIRGLTEGSTLELKVDDKVFTFNTNGTFKVPGGQLAKAVVNGDCTVFCDLITS